MKYTLDIAGSELEVDGITFGTHNGSSEGNIDLFITVFDREEDIFTDTQKSGIWLDWVAKCVGEANPRDRIRKVIAKISGGENDGECYRTITIENACISSFVEHSGGDQHQYEVTIRKSPRKAREDQVKVECA